MVLLIRRANPEGPRWCSSSGELILRSQGGAPHPAEDFRKDGFCVELILRVAMCNNPGYPLRLTHSARPATVKYGSSVADRAELSHSAFD